MLHCSTPESLPLISTNSIPQVCARDSQTTSDKCCLQPPEINPGNKVLVLSKHIKMTRPSHKHIGKNSLWLCLWGPQLKYDLHYWSSSKLFYYICWTGYEGTDKEYQWTAATNLTHTNEIITEFHAWYLDKPGPDHFTLDHNAHVAHHWQAQQKV